MSRMCQWLLAAASSAVLVSGCAVSGLSFSQDDRVDLVYPGENETVRLPLTVEWTVSGFDGSFAVFFDRSPMRPNQSVRALVPDDDPCLRQPGCPDDLWLADRHVYVTSDSRIVIEQLPDTRDNARDKDRHDVTIVLLGEEGRRIGESAFTREFIVDRGD